MKNRYRRFRWAGIFLLCPLLPHLLYAQQLAFTPPESEREVGGQSKNMALASVLQELEKTYQVHFYYQTQDVENKQVVYLRDIQHQQDLKTILRKVLDEFALDYKEVATDYYYVFKKHPNRSPEKIEKEPAS